MKMAESFSPDLPDRPALHISERTRRRDRNEREAEHVALLELARELAWLAGEHPRFATQLNKLMVSVRLQARPSHVKRQRILDALRPSALSVEELREETLLDKMSVEHELTALEGQGIVETCDSQGNPASEHHQGGLWTRYWRLRVSARAASERVEPARLCGRAAGAPRSRQSSG
jgi:DNA-binding transcriptional ArsR family regulator